MIENLESIKENNVSSSVEEKGDLFYDEVYKSGGYDKMYFKHYSKTQYAGGWEKAIEIIKQINDPRVIEIGCGPGQFANLLFDNGITNYKGIDFSSEAINLAKITNEKYNELFCLDNAYTSKIYYEDYNIAILFEVLEHVSNDIDLIKKIRKNTDILFSVPNFYSESHIRWFNNEKEIINRYKDLLNIKQIITFNISTINKLYLVFSEKK